jgi:glycosyltransferase involved in cell wall biosynthesis
MIYHNITPSEFFVDFSPELAAFTHAGRQHLQRLNRVFDLVLADSTYNAAELEALGFGNVSVFPILIDMEAYQRPGSRDYYRLLKDERINLIFVGRITPNKKIEDLIRTLFFFKKYLNPSVRLIVAGNTRTLPGYYYALEDLVSRFHLTSDDIFFTGHIPFPELLAVYRLGDVFLSLSEHEGFCLPLIESCVFEIPVIAYRAGAVAETLDGAGLVINHKDPARTAVLAEKILTDDSLRRDLRQRARQRIVRYKKQSDPELLLRAIQRAKRET